MGIGGAYKACHTWYALNNPFIFFNALQYLLGLGCHSIVCVLPGPEWNVIEIASSLQFFFFKSWPTANGWWLGFSNHSTLYTVLLENLIQSESGFMLCLRLSKGREQQPWAMEWEWAMKCVGECEFQTCCLFSNKKPMPCIARISVWPHPSELFLWSF